MASTRAGTSSPFGELGLQRGLGQARLQGEVGACHRSRRGCALVVSMRMRGCSVAWDRPVCRARLAPSTEVAGAVRQHHRRVCRPRSALSTEVAGAVRPHHRRGCRLRLASTRAGTSKPSGSQGCSTAWERGHLKNVRMYPMLERNTSMIRVFGVAMALPDPDEAVVL